jgi:hypothetical protein
MLQAQFERELHLWQARHEFAEKSSEIAPWARYFLCSLFSTPSADTLSLFELKSRSCPNEINHAFTYAVGRVRGLSF